MSTTTSLRPTFTNKEAIIILRQQFGIIGEVTLLDSYIDQNFKVEDEKGKKYVLKISHPSEKKEFLDAQFQALELLRQNCPQYHFPRYIKTIKAKNYFTITDKLGTQFFVRLFSYLDGTFLSEIKHHSPEMLFNSGRFLGKMGRALLKFDHPALHRELDWDLKNTLSSLDRIQFINNPHQRRLVEYFLLQFETMVFPELTKLRRSVIHNDANENNLLFEINGSEKTEIKGIIDFGDMAFSNTINELAIALAYLMMNKNEPVEAAQHVIKGYSSVLKLETSELEILYHLIAARLCISLTMSALAKHREPDNKYITISEKPAWDLLEKLIKVNPVLAEKQFKAACNIKAPPKNTELDPSQILQLREKHIGKSLSISYQQPLKIIRGALQYLYDDEGRTFLDAVNNVPHVGHCHPKVVKTVQKQMAVLNTNTRYLHDYIVQYAQRLTGKMDNPLQVCFFTNSGSEANDLALRMARTLTGQKDVIVVDSAYHGTTTADIEISPYKFAGKGGTGCEPFIHKVEIPDIFRGRYKSDDPDAGEKYAGHVREAIAEIQKIGKNVAAFISETLMGVAGQIVLPKNYLKEVYRAIREAGGVCIADEVQIGFGRVGTRFWGFETQGVVPDIVTLGKPIGNGFPLAAVVTTKEIADKFANGMEYFNTYGGNPVSCAVGLAVLEVIEQEGLQENARVVGEYLKGKLEELIGKYPLIGDVRGMGLFIGIELIRDKKNMEPADSEAALIVEKMKDEGVLISTDGAFHNVLKIKPPIIFSKANADFLVEKLNKIMDEIAN